MCEPEEVYRLQSGLHLALRKLASSTHTLLSSVTDERYEDLLGHTLLAGRKVKSPRRLCRAAMGKGKSSSLTLEIKLPGASFSGGQFLRDPSHGPVKFTGAIFKCESH